MALGGLLEATQTQYLPLVFTSCFLVWYFHLLIHSLSSPLRSVSGPPLARFSRVWYFRQVWTGRFPWTNIELHRKHEGPVVRIAPNEYSVDDPSAVKTLYGHGTAFTKGPWYDGSTNLKDEKSNLFANRDIKTHAAERRKVASLYSMSTLVKMEDAVNDCIVRLEQRMRDLARLHHGKDPMDLVSGLHDFLTHAARIGVYPDLHPILFKLGKLAGKFQSAGTNGIIRAFIFTRKQIGEYKAMNKFLKSKADDEEAFLPRLLRLHHEKPESVTEEDVMRTCAINVVAGSDTTSISLTGVMWALLRNPKAMAKLRAEVDDKYSSGEIGDPISFGDAQKMPYLQAVIKEGLRLHPAGGLPLSRIVPKGGATIAGHFFPEGFGHGSRTCLGKNIALMEISKLIPQLIRKFDIELADPQMKLETENVWFVKQTNVIVEIKERALSPNFSGS
uniref:Pisatin demethylase n=1 Tax=Fusarium oxysporum (strain Fo5176) TaxID=660025 RepID=A0A0D2XL07_FUSOF